MKEYGTNFIASFAVSDVGKNVQPSVVELPNGGDEIGIEIAYDSIAKLFYIINKTEKVSSNTTSIIDGYTSVDGASLEAFQKDTGITSEGGYDPGISGVNFVNNELVICERNSLNNMYVHAFSFTEASIKLTENGLDITDGVAAALDGKMTYLKFKPEETSIGSWVTTRLTEASYDDD